MCAAIALRNVVGEAEHAFIVAVIPPQCTFHCDAIPLAHDQDGIFQQRRFGAVEIMHEGLDATFVIKFNHMGLNTAPVGQGDAHTRIQEGQFTQAMFQRGKIKISFGKGFRGGQESHFRAALAIR